MRAADVDDNAIAVERLGGKRCSYDESRAMKCLRRAENGAAEGVGDHDMVSNLNGEQGTSSEIANGLAKYAAAGGKNIRQLIGQLPEGDRSGEQQRECCRKSSAVRPAGPMRGCNPPNLA